jgi:serine/threonine protein kinase
MQCSRAAVPWWARVKIAAQVASALCYLHASAAVPVLHRDVKPANVFLDGEWNAKLGDLGLAAATGEGEQGGGERAIGEGWNGKGAEGGSRRGGGRGREGGREGKREG